MDREELKKMATWAHKNQKNLKSLYTQFLKEESVKENEVPFVEFTAFMYFECNHKDDAVH